MFQKEVVDRLANHEEIQKAVIEKLSHQEEFQTEVLRRLDSQEALTEKIFRQINHIRSILLNVRTFSYKNRRWIQTHINLCL